MSPNKNYLKATEVYNLIRQNLPIQNASVDETVDLVDNFDDSAGSFPYQVSFNNCVFKELRFINEMFSKVVTLQHCNVEKADFWACYFFDDLIVDNCTFANDIYLMNSGGHNKPGKLVRIRDTIFKGFVDFSDAWFEGPVEISGCNFFKSSNVLGNKYTPVQVTFDYTPLIHNNSGKLDIDDFQSK